MIPFKRFNAKVQLWLIVIVLCLVALWSIHYKITVLGYTFTPEPHASTWLIEAEISFEARNEPVEVSLAIPQSSAGHRVLDEQVASVGYDFHIDEIQGDRRAIWTTSHASGPQTLFYRVQVFDLARSAGRTPSPPPTPPTTPYFEQPQATAVEHILNLAEQQADDPVGLAGVLIQKLRADTRTPEMQLLFRDRNTPSQELEKVIQILASRDIAARIVRGVQLRDGQRRQPLEDLLEVYDGEAWQIVSPLIGEPGLRRGFILWQRGGRSLLDVYGGENSRLRLSVIRQLRPTRELIEARDTRNRLSLSVYDLPVSDQNVFMVLSLIPLGALILCLVRNVVGIRTSGTFMPILIALAFRETGIWIGLGLFIFIVGVGLVIRKYLSVLNLLLVPRISAVVVVVIGLMGLLSITSFHLEMHDGMAITFFPFIIIAWTIERVSILWEEQGPYEAFMQCLGSLCVAVLTYLAWSSAYVQHLLFAFSELNLVILAGILMLGTYTGYRLTELKRFRVLAENQ